MLFLKIQGLMILQLLILLRQILQLQLKININSMQCYATQFDLNLYKHNESTLSSMLYKFNYKS